MSLLSLFTPLSHILVATQLALPLVVRAIWADPWLLLKPKRIGDVFFEGVWGGFGAGLDEGWRAVKEDLIKSRAHGVVLDVGAGFGSSCQYLDVKRVARYIAVEPNPGMHSGIRDAALAAGFSIEQVTILGCGIEDIQVISNHIAPHEITTILALMVLCSIPSPALNLRPLIHRFLAPGGQLLMLEHVQHPTSRASRWAQWTWTPVWRWWFAGCRLDRETKAILEGIGGWEGEEVWVPEGQGEGGSVNLFPHLLGVFTKCRD